MKNKIKSYGFWTALAGALVVFVNALGKLFGFSVDDGVITNVVMSVAGVLVVLGIVVMPTKEKVKNKEKDQSLNKEIAENEVNVEQNSLTESKQKEDKTLKQK